MGMNEKNETMTAEAVRAKEEYLFSMGAGTQKEIEELKAPALFTDQYGEQYIYCNGNMRGLNSGSRKRSSWRSLSKPSPWTA